MTNLEMGTQGAKVAGVWAVIGITSWADAASFLAFLTSLLVLGEWLWKKAIRPFCVHMGWMAPKRPVRRKEDFDELDQG